MSNILEQFWRDGYAKGKGIGRLEGADATWEKSVAKRLLEEQHGIATMVATLEDRAERLSSLCGEMLATLLIPQNERTVPNEVRGMAEGWKRRYQRIKEDERTSAPVPAV